MPERVFVGLGANLGPAQAALAWALEAMAALPRTRVVAASSFYRSAPVEAAGPDFVNAAAELATGLSPWALLQALHAIEDARGRQRPYPNAPRSLDLDLLLYGARSIDSPGLVLPHPRLHLRAFTLLPLLEIEPALEHPRLGPLSAMQAGVAAQAIERLA